MENDLTGTTLGDFQIEALLGKGSMARVYQARQMSLRRDVALKVLEEGLFTPGDNIRRFLREAEAMARLEHPNIVPVYAAGEQGPYYYFAMRLVRGGTLDAALRLGITRATALEWANDICRGLAFAHGSGVVHRDLKPSNVLIHGDAALLSDFGLARLRDVSTITQLGNVLGTPLYMSPEQTLGEAAGPPADCFAFGVILYQMFTGRHPFLRRERSTLSRAEMRTRLFKRIQNAACPPPSAYDRDFPEALEKVIMGALARRPEDRFPDGAAMLRALDGVSQAGVSGGDRVVRVVPGPGARDDLAHDDGVQSTPVPVAAPQSGQPSDLDETATVSPGAAGADANARATVLGEQAAANSGKAARLVFGRYRVLKEVGHGGQGVVYQAHDPVLDRTVALKVLRGEAMADTHMVELFWHEARIAARLQHPHIITIYDFGIQEQSPYLTMQFVDGPSLDRLLAPGRPLPLPFALQVLAQTAAAIAFAHDAGVLHLDVKPGNILIRGATDAAPLPAAIHAILTDFTMARLRHAAARHRPRPEPRAEMTAMAAGTVSYASPEQLTSFPDALSPASDIFSLGAVFYEMLTGMRLFPGDDPVAAREMVLAKEAAPPSAHVPGLPHSVDELCRSMLARAVNERAQSAHDVAARATALIGTPDSP